MLQAGTDSAELRRCLTIFIYFFVVLVFFSFLKLFFLPVVYVRTGLPFHRVRQHKRGPEKEGEGESPLL